MHIKAVCAYKRNLYAQKCAHKYPKFTNEKEVKKVFGLIKEPLTYQYTEDLICEYGFIRESQLIRLYENMGFSAPKIKAEVNSIRVHGEKVYFDKASKGFFSYRYEEPSPSRRIAMDRCIWVLLDFINRVEHHFSISSNLSPSQICLMLEDRSYEIAYCPADAGPYFDNQLRAARLELLYRAEFSYFSRIVEKDDKAFLEAARYIVVLENIESARYIHSSQIAYFVTLDEENVCTFYSAEEVYKAVNQNV